jgi:murein DD-endopeptidase MepM/ murein hydrolase activator NlpD
MSIFQKAFAWVSKTIHAIPQKVKEIDMRHKLQRGIAQSIDASKGFVQVYKIQALITLLILSLATAGVGIGHTYYQSHVKPIYHVYFHGKEIGVVDHPDVINGWIEKKMKAESDRFAHVQLQAENNQLRFETEELYKPTFDNESALDKLEEEFALKATAVKLVVDGQFIGYVSDEETLHTILDSFKHDFVTQEYLVNMNTQNKQKKNTVSIASLDKNEDISIAKSTINDTSSSQTETLELNLPKMIEAKIKQDIQLETSVVHPSQVLSADQIKEQLSQARIEEKTHKVDSGEVLGSIAQKYNLGLQELLVLNPGLTENSVLQIGQELVVTGLEPVITVETVENLKREEVIDYQVEKKTNAEMYRGDRRIERKGQEGKKIVVYSIIKENGKEKLRKVVNEEIISKPVNQVIVEGTKIKPSRGSGKLMWPTKGGKITSGYGQRWGRLHKGIDIASVRDRTIMASDNGTVITSKWDDSYGYHVIVDHDNGYQTLYAHLSSMSVSRGQVVTKGEKLGVMGSTGNSTGIHLHYEVIVNGRSESPMRHLSR